jgi:S1-C subfamily serine protease
MVTEVRENSPAAKAGLRAGDIILKAGGRTIMNQTDLVRAVNDKKDGEVQLMIDRGGSRQTISVTPEAAKDGNSIFQSGDDGVD